MNKTVKIAFFDTKPYDENSFNRLAGDYSFDITYFHSQLSRKNASLAKGFEVVCAFVNDDLSEEVLNILAEGGVKLIAMRCAGYNNVHLKTAYKNLHVVRVPAYSPYAVAEHVIALIMALNRKTHKAYNRTRDNNFSINGLLGFDMHGRTAGVIGTGKIGRVLIDILLGFGMKVLAYDRSPNREYEKEKGIEFVELDELYRRSDMISLHCPLNAETHHLINEESIAKMKKGIYIINTGRGGLIDTKALIEGLKSKKIGGAGLDVYEEESDYFFEDFSTSSHIQDDTLARLMTFNNVLVSSHQAFFTEEALKNIAETTLNNIKEWIEDKPLTNEVCYKCDNGCRKKEDGRCFD